MEEISLVWLNRGEYGEQGFRLVCVGFFFVCTLCYLTHILVSGEAAFRLPASPHQLLEDPATNTEKKERGDVRCVHRRVEERKPYYSTAAVWLFNESILWLHY